jgi:Cupin
MTERTDRMTKTPKASRRGPTATMPADLLSDVLGLLALQGEVFCRTELSAPWGLRLVRQSAHFHMIERGAVWFEIESTRHGFEAVAGDLVVLSHGNGHCMMDRPGRTAVPLELSASATTRRPRSAAPSSAISARRRRSTDTGASCKACPTLGHTPLPSYEACKFMPPFPEMYELVDRSRLGDACHAMC